MTHFSNMPRLYIINMENKVQKIFRVNTLHMALKGNKRKVKTQESSKLH